MCETKRWKQRKKALWNTMTNRNVHAELVCAVTCIFMCNFEPRLQIKSHSNIEYTHFCLLKGIRRATIEKPSSSSFSFAKNTTKHTFATKLVAHQTTLPLKYTATQPKCCGDTLFRGLFCFVLSFVIVFRIETFILTTISSIFMYIYYCYFHSTKTHWQNSTATFRLIFLAIFVCDEQRKHLAKMVQIFEHLVWKCCFKCSISNQNKKKREKATFVCLGVHDFSRIKYVFHKLSY